MFCQMCGKDLGDTTETLCEDCKTKSNQENSFNQGAEAKTVEFVANDNTTGNQNNASTSSTSNNTVKSKLAAGLFGIFLGAFGVHNFYLGYTGKAIAQLLITLLTCGFGAAISSIWGLIEGILILTGEINTDANGNPLKED